MTDRPTPPRMSTPLSRIALPLVALVVLAASAVAACAGRDPHPACEHPCPVDLEPTDAAND